MLPRALWFLLVAMSVGGAAGAAPPVVAGTATRPGRPAVFQFGTEPAPAAVTVVPASARYADATGYGFEPGGQVAIVTNPAFPAAPFREAATSHSAFCFSVKVAPGNYRVTVTLGNPMQAAVTTVKAETRRLMLEQIHTAAGEWVQRSFLVNVRGPKLADGTLVNLDSREMDLATQTPTARHWDDRLTLEFSGDTPSVAAIEVRRDDRAITLFITGDSTVTDQPRWPGSSWGQMIPRWFKSDVAVANHAESGETLKGFLKERRWDKVLESLRPGDYVLIEFGTNDSKDKGPQNIYPGQDFAETYAPAATTYKELLRRFVADVEKRGGHPIIASPSARRGEAREPTSLAAYARAAMDVARELRVPGIDLNAMGVTLNRALGPDAEKQFGDRTHHVEYGSYLQAKCIALGLQQAHIPLAEHLVRDFQFDPEHPAPRPAEFDLPPDPLPEK